MVTGYAPTVLYHYTCVEHGAPNIIHDNLIIPHLHPLIRAQLAWLTDLDTPDRIGLGLTAGWISCDRTAVRVTVPVLGAIRWGHWAHAAHLPRVLREILEDGALPGHWWVSPTPVPVLAIRSLARSVTS